MMDIAVALTYRDEGVEEIQNQMIKRIKRSLKFARIAN